MRSCRWPTLSYSINDTRFIQDKNIFTWQTTYEDYGEYNLLITATDGSLNDSKVVKVIINNINRAPVLNNIADIMRSKLN